MPLYDFRCLTETCGKTFEHYLPLARYKETPACPDCDGTTTREYLPAGARSAADAVVVYKAPDGTYRFLGDAQGVSAAAYHQKGFERVELRGWADVRRFESHVNKQEFSRICQRMERVAAQREEGERLRSSEFRRGLEQGFQMPELDARGNRTGRMKTVHMSERGRGLARAIAERNRNKPSPRSYEPGFRVEAYSESRSNRLPSLGPDGRRRRD